MSGQGAGWRASILEHFGEQSARASQLTVVRDPDGLLTEPGIAEELAERGFELLAAEDPVAFRFAYQTRFRRRWDLGKLVHAVVVLRGNGQEARDIPFDVMDRARRSGRLLSFSLGSLFPTLSADVVGRLDRGYLDILWHAAEVTHTEPLGTNATRDFVLRHVFEIAPELIKQPADLLRVLLRCHYRALTLPAEIADRLVETLCQRKEWQVWPLERIVRSREHFLAFLAERWPAFLVEKGFELIPGREPPQPTIAGPVVLPFDHDDIRVYMDNLFMEGLLAPTTAVNPEPTGGWYNVGIAGSPATSAESRFLRLSHDLREAIPPAETARFPDWQHFAQRWATWSSLRWRTKSNRSAVAEGDAEALAMNANLQFSQWLLKAFAPLASHPFLPQPVMGHHVPHYLAHARNTSAADRIALLVIDGMAFDQWRVLAEGFDAHEVEEHAIFSWIPTLTQVSRQAIFAGKAPFEFAGSIRGTFAEPNHWRRFWQDAGLDKPQVSYLEPQGHKGSFEPLAAKILEAADDSRIRVLGAVINVIDQNMHQIGLGSEGLHGLVQVWAGTRQLPNLVSGLLERDMAVFLTSDHGNVFGRGFGKPNVGDTVDQRGERAHIFRDRGLREQTANLFPTASPWPNTGLPDDYFPLLAPYGACFLPEGAEAVSHGGISIEEVVVPFVRIRDAR